MRKSLMILVVMAPALLAQGGANCKDVGGAVLTNFLDQTTTLGTATGDLKGGLGVTVLSLSSGPGGTVLFHNHHHWVTEAGDTIFFSMMRTPSHIQRAFRVCMQPATRTASPLPVEPGASRERRESSPRSAPSI